MLKAKTIATLQGAAHKLEQYLQSKQSCEPPAKRLNNDDETSPYKAREFDALPHAFYKSTQGNEQKPPLAVQVLGGNKTESDLLDADII